MNFACFCIFFISFSCSSDDFGWEKRINVATQLADLLTWLHKKKIAVGSVTASCIMIDKVEFKPFIVFLTLKFPIEIWRFLTRYYIALACRK